MRNAYVQSQYDRNPDDHYPTIDERCVIAINATWDIPTPCIDPFHGAEPTPLYPAVNGQLRDLLGAPNAILTNPPYKRGLVDELMGQCITLVKDGVIDLRFPKWVVSMREAVVKHKHGSCSPNLLKEGSKTLLSQVAQSH